jgi:hypothetical protein
MYHSEHVRKLAARHLLRGATALMTVGRRSAGFLARSEPRVLPGFFAFPGHPARPPAHPGTASAEPRGVRQVLR